MQAQRGDKGVAPLLAMTSACAEKRSFGLEPSFWPPKAMSSATTACILALSALPKRVSGNDSTTSMPSGHLHLALPFWTRNSATSLSEGAVQPSRRMTKAQTFSLNTGSGIATTRTSAMDGCWPT